MDHATLDHLVRVGVTESADEVHSVYGRHEIDGDPAGSGGFTIGETTVGRTASTNRV